MKRIAIMIVFVLTLGSQAIAGNLAKLKIRTNTQNFIELYVDGQLVSTEHSVASVTAIAGYHHLKVVKLVQHPYYNSLYKETIFSDNVFLPANTITHALVAPHQFVIEEQFAFQMPPHNGNGATCENHAIPYHHKPPCAKPKPSTCGVNNNLVIYPPIVVDPQVQLYPMQGARFNQLKNSIENQWFSDGKYNVFSSALNKNHFTSAQVNELVNLFSFSSDKLKVAKKAYHKTLDTENYFVVYDSLEFDSSVRNLSNYIASL